MTDLAPLLLLFACGWLLACLWLVLMGRLLNQLSRNEPAAYAALGKPVIRWLWWSWPASAPHKGSRLFLQARGRKRRTVETRSRIHTLHSLSY